MEVISGNTNYPIEWKTPSGKVNHKHLPDRKCEEERVTTQQISGNSRKGFASMTVERRREIASRGGKSAHRKGTAHKFTSEEGAAAGRIGGKKSRRGDGKKKENGV